MEPDTPKFICQHLTESVTDMFVWFTSVGKELNWTCGACAKNYPSPPETWVPATEEWLVKNRDRMYWEGICGTPEVKQRATDLCFSTRDLVLEPDWGAFVEARPCIGRPSCWHALSLGGILVLFSSVNGEVITSCKLEDLGLEITAETGICFAPVHDFAVVYETAGPNAVLVNTQTGKTIRRLSRGDRYLNTGFPVTFFVHEGSTFLIAASDWNRLDIYESSTGQLLTERSPTSYVNDQRPPHYLDYCHGSLSVSPHHQFVVDDGWVWHPWGILRSWNLSAWLSNVWESEDGTTVKELAQRDYFWGGPVCWIDNTKLVFWGWGRDDDWLVPAAVLVDVLDGQILHWFPGPNVRKSRRHSDSSFFFDRHLFAVDDNEGTTVWDINTGECLLTDKDVKPWRYHPDSKEFLDITPAGFRLSRLVG